MSAAWGLIVLSSSPVSSTNSCSSLILIALGSIDIPDRVCAGIAGAKEGDAYHGVLVGDNL
jgi:hypothetical protein